LDRRLGVPQSQSGCSDEEEDSQPLPGFEPLITQPIAQHYKIACKQTSCHFLYGIYIFIQYINSRPGADVFQSVPFPPDFLGPS
jgi:hypothetical protein